MRRTREAIGLGLVLLFATICLGALAAPLFEGKVYLNDDLGLFHYPLRYFYGRSLAAGEGVLWCPNLFCGFYLQGEGQVGMAHPWHLLLYSALSTPVAINLELLASYPWAFAGVYLFLRRRRLGRDASALGGMMFAFAGFNLFHYMHLNGVAIVAQIPWLLFCSDVAIRAEGRVGRAWGRLGVGLGTASQILLGYPQYVCFSLIAEGLFFLFLVGESRGIGWRKPAGWVVAKGLGLLAGSAQLLPTFDLLANSNRVGMVCDPGFASLHPFNLIQVVAPYQYKARVVAPSFYVKAFSFPVKGPAEILLDWRAHEFGLYNGAIVPSLLIWLWLRRRELGRSGPLALGSAVLAVLALALAIGDYNPLFGLYTSIPLTDRFRIPARHVVLYHLATAVLAAIALADLTRFARESRPLPWRRLALLGAPLALAVAAWVGPDYLGSAWPAALREVPRSSAGTMTDGLILVGLAGLLTALAARGHRLAPIGLLILAGVDQSYYLTSYLHHTRSIGPPPAPSPALQEARVAVIRKEVPPNQMIVAGHRLVDGYVGLAPMRRLDYDSEVAWRAAAVRVSYDSSLPPASSWKFINGALPRARLVSRAVLAADRGRIVTPAEATADLAVIDQASVALVHRPLVPALDGGGPPGSATILGDRAGAVDIETDSPSRRLLVLSESYYPGWRVEVDGQSAEVLRVDHDFQGCVVGPGRHRVAWRFDPESARLGLRLSALGLALMLASFVRTNIGRPPGARS